jgi:hypothetical protein
MGTITGREYVGGLVGYSYGSVSNCYATGTINGSEAVGGLVGYNKGDASNCYAISTVTGEQKVGGLIGNLYNDATVSKCYAACEVIADSNDSIGGLIGKNTGQTTDSFWDVQVSGQQIGAGGVGLSTAELQYPETYLNAGWDFTGEVSNGVADIWTITEPNTYPQLTRLDEQYPITQLDGSGTPDDPYKIATAEDMMTINFHDNINAHYALFADIDMSGMVWTAAPISFFNGTFDGRGYTISNLTIKAGGYNVTFGGRMNPVYTRTLEGSNNIGLFGRILANGVVTNLTIQDADIIGYRYVGALAGQSFGHITNCHVTGNVTGYSVVGGVVGSVRIPRYDYGAYENYISDCTADVKVFGIYNVNNIANVIYYD